MKKLPAFLLVFGLVLAILGAAGAAVLGWDWPGGYRDESLGLWYPEDVSAIVIEGGSAAVRVYDSEDPRLEAVAQGWTANFAARLEDGVLYLTRSEDASFLHRLRAVGQDPELILWLPGDYAGDLTLRTGSGEANLHGARIAGAVELSTDTGTVSVYDSRLGSLSAQTGSGDVFLGDVALSGALDMSAGSGLLYAGELRGVTELTAQTGSGDIQLQDLEAESITAVSDSGYVYLDELRSLTGLWARTDSGDISLEDPEAPEIALATLTGSIRGELEGDMADYTLSAVTRSGSTNLPREFAGGSARLTIDTDSGDIYITFS